MKIEYCESCRKRLTQHDVENGQATWIGNLIYCKKCIKTKEIQNPNPGVNVSAQRMPSPAGLRALAHNSGLLNVSTGPKTNIGSGRYARPNVNKHRRKSPSGTHTAKKKTHGSAIRRAKSDSGVGHKNAAEPKPGSGIQASPGSGIRAKSPAKSGLRAPKNLGSGLRTIPTGTKPGVKRSGIHNNKDSNRTIKTESRHHTHGGHGRRGRARRTRNDNTTMISIIGILVGVSVGAIIFFSLIY